MTSSSDFTPAPKDSNPPTSEEQEGIGVLPEHEGIILQRGGEELVLEKTSDRFTIRLANDRPLQNLAQQPGVRSVQTVPSMELLELQVDPQQLDRAMALARSSQDVAFASHVYQLKDSSQAAVYLTDELTIQFTDQIEPETVEAIAAELGIATIQPVIGVPQTYVFRVTAEAAVNPIKLANQLMRRPEVLTAEPNVVIETQGFYRPRDSLYGKQWYLNHAGGSGLAANSHISAELAWDITRGSRSIVVAVSDDAFDLAHPDFQGKGKLVAPRDLKGRDFLPTPDTLQESHGTAAAGLAIAEENGSGIVGVAPDCAFMPIRTTGFLDDDAIESIFVWAINHGASVISCSWGPSAIYFPLSMRQRAVITRAATEGRNGKGCVIVFAAGNANRPVNGAVHEQAWQNNLLQGPTNWLNGFAVHPDVITVSACTSLNQKAAYSNWGNTISISAPSNNGIPGTFLPKAGYVQTAPPIRTTLAGKGGMFTLDRLGPTGYDSGDFTESFGGTSSACPIVAGVAALVLAANPDLTAKEVKQILQSTADKVVDATPDPQLGLRRGTYDTNGHSEWFGYGKVNAHKAVLAAKQRLSKIPNVSQRLQQENSNPVDIPDSDIQGVTSPIQISNAAPIRGLRISVDVEHSFLGDVEITLIAPNGLRLLLQSRILGRQTRLQTTYSVDTNPVLSQLLNQSATGRWQLHLADHAPQNTGRLNRWQLEIGL